MPLPPGVQGTALMHAFYLHGFASSAASTKAGYFARRLGERGITLHTPDFNEPDFSSLTITRMIDQTLASIAALPPDPVVLIGSSLGAFVAIQAAVRAGSAPGAWPRVDRLVLLAPALGFAAPGEELSLGDRTMEEWKASGVTNVFHYGYGRVMPVGYALYTDACGYDCMDATLDIPVLVFQGRQDTVVDPARVEAWASARPNVELHLLDDDHQLASSLDTMWPVVERFL